VAKLLKQVESQRKLLETFKKLAQEKANIKKNNDKNKLLFVGERVQGGEPPKNPNEDQHLKRQV